VFKWEEEEGAMEVGEERGDEGRRGEERTGMRAEQKAAGRRKARNLNLQALISPPGNAVNPPPLHKRM
jgi:hypothetical protein